MMSKGTTPAIGSPGLAAGPTPSDLPDGTDLFGQALAPANHSLLRGNGGATPTSATSGLRGSVSSASAILTQSLANRLAARLDSVGSMLWRSTWSRKVTPLGRAYWAHTASERHTSGNGCGSWPTPTCNEAQRNLQRRIEDRRQLGLSEIVQLASWPTPAASSGERFGQHPERINPERTFTINDAARMTGWATPASLEHAVKFASWPTPLLNDATGSQYAYASGDHNKPVLKLPGAANLVSWATPRANDAEKRGIPADDPRNGLVTQVQQTSGPAATGSPAATAKPGQLNPAHSRWLMGYPPEWDACAPTETRSALRRRKRSSEHT